MKTNGERSISQALSLSGEVLAFLTNPVSRRDPYALYKWLQIEEPVYRAGYGTWLVTRYDDVVRILADSRFSVDINNSPQIRAIAQPSTASTYVLSMMSMRDAPDHDRLHRLVRGFFTTRRARQFRPHIEAIVDEMLDVVADAGRMDVIDDLAYHLPVNVTCTVFGIPRVDWPLVQEWTESLTQQITLFNQSDYDMRGAEASLEEFANYIKVLSDERYANPADDLLSALALAAVDGDQLDERELIALCMLILVAGRGTVTNMIGNSILTLLRHPDQFDHLRTSHPSLTRSAYEECLRFESPLRLGARIALEDVGVGGKVIPRGEVALAVFAAANRDPERFAEPERFNIARVDNHHLAFGHGTHFCLGHAYARVEGEVVLDRFLRRLTDIQLLVDEADLPWSDSLVVRGLESLPISFRSA